MNAMPNNASFANTTPNNVPVERRQRQRSKESFNQATQHVTSDEKNPEAKSRKASYLTEQKQQSVAPIDERSKTNDGTGKDINGSTETSTFLREWTRILSTQVPRGIDDRRTDMDNKIEELRRKVRSDPEDVNLLARLSMALKARDVQFADGGTDTDENLLCMHRTVDLLRHKLENSSISENERNMYQNMICQSYVSLGFVLFKSERYQDAASIFSEGLDLGFCEMPWQFNMMETRSSANIVLGNYEDAVKDQLFILENDDSYFFTDSINGLVRVLGTKSGRALVPGGWKMLMSKVDDLLIKWNATFKEMKNSQGLQSTAKVLHRLHLSKFHYFEKQKDFETAFDQLQIAQEYKQLYREDTEMDVEGNLQAIKSTFSRKTFLSLGSLGSSTKVPIFIIGYPRSGSTLLERILDAHPSIAGLSEDSVMNGRLNTIRMRLAEAISSNDMSTLMAAIFEEADLVEKAMFQRWERLSSDSFYTEDAKISSTRPKRLVDKMLTNWSNVGFIQFLYPSALIIHVARNPMDTAFSCYKHEFMVPGLDVTSHFDSLSKAYTRYRGHIDHWDDVLPGRIMHIRYEEMVHDLEGVARAVINATGLPWYDEILDFHKKKHATNTYSTTQVKERVYTSSINSWKKYEKQLQPLVERLGKYADLDLTTRLPGYEFDTSLMTD